MSSARYRLNVHNSVESEPLINQRAQRARTHTQLDFIISIKVLIAAATTSVVLSIRYWQCNKCQQPLTLASLTIR